MTFNTRIAEVGVAFFYSDFFYSDFFNIISEKKVKIFFFLTFFSKMFFEKLNFYFSKKSKLCDILSQLGNARVKL